MSFGLFASLAVMRTRNIVLAAAVLLAIVLSACGDQTDTTSPTASDTSTGLAASTPPSSGGGGCEYAEDANQDVARQVELPPAQPSVSGKVQAVISTSAGDLGVVLDAEGAPCTVNSFVSLAEQAYFDDTPCHRLTTAASGIFVLQCGDPSGTGYGGPGYTIPDELMGAETYPAGTLAMARTSAPHSGGSQFFIVYEQTPLPPDYAVFGRLKPAGLRVLQEIAANGTADGGADGPPKTPVTIESVTFAD